MITFGQHASDFAKDLYFQPCMKKPITVYAVQIDTEFRVDSMEGDYKQGKPGDYLMCGIDNELYICDKDIFERSYDFTEIKL